MVCRRQFPLCVDYASTMHRAQGRTLDKVVIDTREDVFTHGQLYVALGRARTANDILLFTSPARICDSAVFAHNITFAQLLLPTNRQPPFLIDDPNSPMPPPPRARSIMPRNNYNAAATSNIATTTSASNNNNTSMTSATAENSSHLCTTPSF